MRIKLRDILKVTCLSGMILSHASFAEEGVVAPRPEGTSSNTTPIPSPTSPTPNIEPPEPSAPVISETSPPTPTTPVTTSSTPPVVSTTPPNSSTNTPAVVTAPATNNTATNVPTQQYTAADPFSMTSTVFTEEDLNNSLNISANLQMFSLETQQNMFGLLFSFADLQKDAEIISAQLEFTNAHEGDYIDGQLRFYAENNASPDMFSLENPASLRTLGAYYANYVNQYKRKQGEMWRADVSAPVQALFKKGYGSQRIVLIAKGLNAQAVQTPFLNYTFNENTVKLRLTVKNVVQVKKAALNNILTEQVFNDLKALPSMKQAGFNLTHDADILQADMGNVCFKLQADSMQSAYLRAALPEVNVNHSKISFNLNSGTTLNAHAVVQNLSALQTALQQIAAVQNITVQNDGAVAVNLANDSLFLLRPDVSSTPNNQLATGLVEQNNQTFLVFYDSLGVLRQQALYPVALHPEELQTALQNIAPAVQLSEENGVVTVNVAGQNFQAKLSHIVSKNMDNSPLGLRVIGDMNHDGKADYQMTYSDGNVQVLYSL